MPRDFTRKSFSHIKNHRAKELFELYEDLRYFEWEQDYSILDSYERLQKSVVRETMHVVHEAAMELEYGKKDEKAA